MPFGRPFWEGWVVRERMREGREESTKIFILNLYGKVLLSISQNLSPAPYFVSLCHAMPAESLSLVIREIHMAGTNCTLSVPTLALAK
jgi:hypothetical protein